MSMATKLRELRKPKEPTKAELYRKARRLGVEGRSKMNKRALKAAVGRHEPIAPRRSFKVLPAWSSRKHTQRAASGRRSITSPFGAKTAGKRATGNRPSRTQAVAAAGVTTALLAGLAYKLLRSGA